MPKNEADTRAHLIDPALYKAGWTQDLIRREKMTGGAKSEHTFTDYELCLPSKNYGQPLPVAVVEAKRESLTPEFGLEQAKYDAKRLNLLFAFSTNGHRFVEFNWATNKTSESKPLAEFPTPDDLKKEYQKYKNIDLDSKLSEALFIRYYGGDLETRYYQKAAIRAALEKIATGEKRILLTLATGVGKTFLTVQLLHKIQQAGLIKRALFVCDRTELAKQGAGALENIFGDEVGRVTGKNPQNNAKIMVATYQTLGVDKEDDEEASFLLKNYPENYFSHIIIDECHRSAWGKWSAILTRNADAVQIGLTATPRIINVEDEGDGNVEQDKGITANNIKYFGEPVYEYTILQGQEDGFLASMELIRREIHVEGEEVIQRDMLDDNHDDRNPIPEINRYLTRETVLEHNPVIITTGQSVGEEDISERYEETSYGRRLIIEERLKAMCVDLFDQMIANGGDPFQRTIIFCPSDSLCDQVAIFLNNLLVERGYPATEAYAFKCTGASKEDPTNLITKLKKSRLSHFIATTVDLLSTGVDIPRIQNIVFFRYLKSPILFYQMLGRGTRLDVETAKTMFSVYDYTNVSRLFGKDDIKKAPKKRDPKADPPPTEPKPIIKVSGFTVNVNDAGKFVLADLRGNGKEIPVPIEEYQGLIGESVSKQAHSLDELREKWILHETRDSLLKQLPTGPNAAFLIRSLNHLEECDLYDVLGQLSFGVAPKKRLRRVDDFNWKHQDWLSPMPASASTTILRIADFFKEDGGIEEIDNPMIFNMPIIRQSGGLNALKLLKLDTLELLNLIKERLLAA